MEWNRIKKWVGVFSFPCVQEFIKEGMYVKKKKMVIPQLDTSLLYASFKKGGQNEIFHIIFFYK